MIHCCVQLCTQKRRLLLLGSLQKQWTEVLVNQSTLSHFPLFLFCFILYFSLNNVSSILDCQAKFHLLSQIKVLHFNGLLYCNCNTGEWQFVNICDRRIDTQLHYWNLLVMHKEGNEELFRYLQSLCQPGMSTSTAGKIIVLPVQS